MTLVEVIIAMAVLSMLMGAVLSAVNLSAKVQLSTAERLEGGVLAWQLAEDIASRPYEDPTTTGEFGPGLDENASDRTTFDDVDDFDGWKESPPLHDDGTALTGRDGWELLVRVEPVDGTDLRTARPGEETGVKLVVVVAQHNGREAARVGRLRSKAGDTMHR